MSRVPCSDEFLLNVGYQKKNKKEKTERNKGLISFINLGWRFNEFFYVHFHDSWSNTVYTLLKLQTTPRRYDADKE